MARSRGGYRIQPRRSSRLRELSFPKTTITEPIDLVESSDQESEHEILKSHSQTEKNMADQQISRDSQDGDFQNTRPRTYRRITNPEEIKKIKLQKTVRYKTTGRRHKRFGNNYAANKEANEEEEEDAASEEANEEEEEHAATEETNEEEEEQLPEQPAQKVKNTKLKRKTTEKVDDLNLPKQMKRKKNNAKINEELDEAGEAGEGAVHINKTKELVKIRNSPKLLSDMLGSLSDDQQHWVEESGFKAVLDFDLQLLPAKLAYNVLQVFDSNSVSIKIRNGNMFITEKDVFDVIGLPAAGQSITIGSFEKHEDRIRSWFVQFPNDQVTTAMVVEKIKGAAVDQNFKLNFLVVLSNVLMRTSTHSYIDRQMLRFDGDIDRSCQYNWAAYLIENLVSATIIWNRTTSVFYSGSLIFLTLFYVDRVRHRGLKFVERQFPSYKGWNEDKLKQRQSSEVIQGLFGTGSILPPLREVLSQDNQPVKNQSPQKDHEFNDWDTWNNYENQYEDHQFNFQNQNNDDNQKIDETDELPQSSVEDKQKKEEEDRVDALRDMATKILDLKVQFDAEMLKAKELYPKNDQLQLIQDVFDEVFNPENVKTADVGHSYDDQDKNPSNSATPKRSYEVAEDFELLPEDIANLDLIAYLHSKKKGKQVNDFTGKDDLIPSFSLGIEMEDDIISKVCEDISTEEDNQEKQNEEFVTPEQVVMDKSKRERKLGPYGRSPFLNRVIDINAKYTNQDFALWRYMLKKDNPYEEVFNWNDIICVREHLTTLKVDNCLSYSVIDVWCVILNHNEDYKSDESPLCLFPTIGCLASTLDVVKSVTITYPIFASNMDSFFELLPTRKLQNIDMVFFPIYAYEHYYLICYNLKNPTCELIDNIKREDNPKHYYGKTPNILQSHFAKYLQAKGLDTLGKTIRKLKPIYLTMEWQTEHNSTDCGIFLMRHMETYKGDRRSWETNFKNEGCGQSKQMIRLRTKYNTAILTSQLNEVRDKVLTKTKDLFNEAAENKLMNLVIKERQGVGINTELKNQGASTSKKTISFAADLDKTFEETNVTEK